MSLRILNYAQSREFIARNRASVSLLKINMSSDHDATRSLKMRCGRKHSGKFTAKTRNLHKPPKLHLHWVKRLKKEKLIIGYILLCKNGESDFGIA